MKILIYVVFYVVAVLFLYFKTSLFISQYYDAKRMILLDKQKYKEWNKNVFNMFPFIFLFSSIGFIFYNPLIANILIVISLMIKLVRLKKITFKFTRRSITLLIFSCLIPLVSLLCTDYIPYILMFVLIVFESIMTIISNYVLLPIELIIREHYIREAKKKIGSAKNLKIIAITGSYGKTSFKNYLYTLLCGKYNVLKTPGSVNTPLGVCKFINNNLTPYEDILILELGVDTPNTMKKFFKMFKPTLGIVTAIGEMHLATFKSISNIQKEKLSLFDSVTDPKGMFYNKDSPYMDLDHNYKKIATSYGLDDVNDIFYSIDGTQFTYKGNKCVTKLLGKYQLTNLIGTIKVAEYLGLPFDYIYKRLSLIHPEEHRMNIIRMNSTTFIDDSYNANYLGLSEAINLVGGFHGKKGIILNGIIEAGVNANKQNYEIGKMLKSFDEIVVLSSSNEKLIEGLEKIRKKYKKFNQYNEGLVFLKKKKLDYILLCSRAEKDFIK